MEARVNQTKLTAVQEIKDFMGTSKEFFFVDFRGVTVEQISLIRKQLRKSDVSGRIKIVKNNYAKIALKDLGYEGLDSFLVGPTAIAVANQEAGPVAKTLFENTGKASSMVVKAGYINKEVYNAAKTEAYSKLPTRIELIQLLMATLQAPTQKLAATLLALKVQKEGTGE